MPLSTIKCFSLILALVFALAMFTSQASAQTEEEREKWIYEEQYADPPRQIESFGASADGVMQLDVGGAKPFVRGTKARVVLSLNNKGNGQFKIIGVRCLFAQPPIGEGKQAQALDAYPSFCFNRELDLYPGSELQFPVSFELSDIAMGQKTVRVFFNVMLVDEAGKLYKQVAWVTDYAPIHEDETFKDLASTVLVLSSLALVGYGFVNRDMLMKQSGLFDTSSYRRKSKRS